MQKVEVVVLDDIDGSVADATIRFGLDGTDYEIDLNEAHARSFRETLQSYIGAARKVGGTARPGRAGARRGGRGAAGSAEVREWAKSQGLDVKDRGRVPSEVIAKFKAATGG